MYLGACIPFMKLSYQFIFGLLAVIFLAGFLSLSYFQTNNYNSAKAAVPDVGQIEPVGSGFGGVVCDYIIPIGEPLEKTVNLLATIYEANQTTAFQLDLASNNLSSIYAKLNENKAEVCDWKKCSPNFANLGPDFKLELDAVIKKWSIGGQLPLPVDKECTGSPCPILGSPDDEKLAAVLAKAVEEIKADDLKTTEEQKTEFTQLTPIGTLIGLESIIARQEKIVQELFDESNPTEVVTEDLALGDAGTKISKTAMIQRKAAKAAQMIKECTLSETEKKLALSGRLGDKYPMTCQSALANGQYWPLAWSEYCKTECLGNQAGSDECIKCLKEPRLKIDLGSASTLAQLNYEIYNQCEKDYFNGVDDKKNPIIEKRAACYNEATGDWEMTEACMECLCTNREFYTIEGGADQVRRTRMDDDECLAWLCGGNEHNWACCHQTPIDWPVDFVDDSEPDAQVFGLTSGGQPGRTGQTFIASAYTPLRFLEGKKTSSGQGVSLGSLAVDRSVIPLGSCVKIKYINFDKDEKGNAWPTGLRNLWAPSADNVLETLGNYEKTFCANDVGDTKNKKNIIGKRIDIWLPNMLYGRAWGRREIDVTWWYDPGNPCYKGVRDVTGSFDRNFTNCGVEPTTDYAETVIADDFTFNYGKDKQFKDASPALRELLSCLKEEGKKYPTGWAITSISDSNGYDECANHWTDPTCAHAKNSCHYGGVSCKSGADGGSMAIDVSAKYGGANNIGDKIAAAACECAKNNPNLGVVTAAKEGVAGSTTNPLHYHISVQNAACNCDSKGQRSDNQCRIKK